MGESKYKKDCKYLLCEEGVYYCLDTETEKVRNYISFCPLECKKCKIKEQVAENFPVTVKGGSDGSL